MAKRCSPNKECEKSGVLSRKRDTKKLKIKTAKFVFLRKTIYTSLTVSLKPSVRRRTNMSKEEEEKEAKKERDDTS